MIKKRKNNLTHLVGVSRTSPFITHVLSSCPSQYRKDLHQRMLTARGVCWEASNVDHAFCWAEQREGHSFWEYIHAGEFQEAYSYLRRNGEYNN